MDLGIIRPINIDVEMQASYLDYAMSVIVARALPDVRDGLKPVHRRILYAMHDLGLDPDKPYKKSARIVGEVLGKYHPHGDVAVYEAMVRMAQDFSLRYPLVDGQGNFGSVDGDNAAAMRYTEARLAPIAVEMLADIEKDTVEWTDNFDGTLNEPSVLPAALPNLVVNGASGIAVGMSTNIPPHNLGEVCDALCYLIDNYRRAEEVPVEELMQFIPGPDFPTGGLIYRYQHENGTDGEEQVDVIARAYASGKGRIVVQAKAHIEEMSRNRSRIVVTELPYQTNKSNLMERIAELVRDGRLDGITDLRDESDRTGMRICIETTRTVEPRDVLRELYKLTPLQGTFSISLLALVEGQPLLLSLKRLLLHFLEHRQEVIRRRSEYDLRKARQRAHILEGLLRALDVLDQVIALIRGSRTADTAKQGLMKEFEFTELQAQAILDLQLRRLAALERKKLQDEYKEVIALIKELEELLASPKKVLALIRKDLVQLKATYGDPRRTQIADRVKGALTTIDVLPDQEVWVTLNAGGVLMRRPKDSFDPAWRKKLAADAGAALTGTNTRNDLYLFSAKGQAVRLGVHQVPEGNGAHFADLSGLTRRDRIVAILALPKPQADGPTDGLLVLGTAQGKVKRINLSDLTEQAHTNPQVINLDSNDELAWVDRSAGGGEVLLMTAQGQAIRFIEDDVRAMGLPAGGIGGIRLKARDRVVGGLVVPAGTRPDSFIATVTDKGWGKRTLLSEFPAQGRNGQGVVAAKVSPRSGKVAGVALMVSDEALLCLLGPAGSRVLAGDELPAVGRAALGKVLFALPLGQQVTNVAAIPGLAPAPPVAPPTSRSAAPKADGAKTARSTAAKAAGAAVAVKAAKASADATASPSARRSAAASSDKAPKSPGSTAQRNAPPATEPEAPPAKAAAAVAVTTAASATAVKAPHSTDAATRKAATAPAEPPKPSTAASSRSRSVKTAPPAAAPRSEPEATQPRKRRASAAAKTAPAAPASAPSGAPSKTTAPNGATADAKLAAPQAKTTQTIAPNGSAQGKTAGPATSKAAGAVTPVKKRPPAKASSSKSGPAGAASTSTSKAPGTQPAAGPGADQVESGGGRVFNRADLAKLISTPKKPVTDAAKPQPSAASSKPATETSSPDGKPPQAAGSRKPASTPRTKQSADDTTG